jgi:citrate lyase subunit beta/citryl-CoA lyase
MQSLARARSFLFVPGNRLERIEKALKSGAHAVIVDLEDAVLPKEKSSARQGLLEAWSSIPIEDRRRIMVRINASGSEWHAADTAAMTRLSAERLGGIVLPKAESVAALEQVLEATRRSPLIPLIESAAGLHAIELIARVPGVLRLAFGHLDFQLDLGLHCEPDETELTSVRLALVQASRRANLASPVDGVTVDLDDDARLAADKSLSPMTCCRRRRRSACGLRGCWKRVGAMAAVPFVSRARWLMRRYCIGHTACWNNSFL